MSTWHNQTPEQRLDHMIYDFGFDGALTIAIKRQAETLSSREDQHYDCVIKLWHDRCAKLRLLK